MAKIAYVDHSFHQTTQSTGFLAAVLRRSGHEVDAFWDDAWRGGSPVAWHSVASHDVVIMFQSYCLPDRKSFRESHPNVIYIPMLDQFALHRGPLLNLSTFWEPFQGSKVLNFSNQLQCMTTAFGIASHVVRYYQPIADGPVHPRPGLHGFFWLRREHELPWRTIRALLAGTRFDSFHIHLATDPGTPPPVLPSAEDIDTHRITTSTWFENKADLDTLMTKANVYFAPRLEEGIGQSFLEAMGRSQCVVAPDHGTMNEYIVPGVNGLLYEATRPQPLDFSDAASLGRRARQGALAGRSIWERAQDDLVRFILTPSEQLYVGKYRHVPATVHGSVAEPDRPDEGRPMAGQDRLRGLAQRHAVFRSTRFLWHPLIRWARQLFGRRA